MIEAGYVIGADIGGGSARVAAVGPDGVIARKIKVASNPELGYKPLVANVRAAMDKIMAAQKAPPLAMCVACAGAVDFSRNMIASSPNFPGWRDVPLAEDLGRGRPFAVSLENDANAAAYGEGWIGAATGWEDFAMLTLGTGVGGGIVLGGAVYHGFNGMAGEIGHLPFSAADILCGCGRRGCLETTASASGVARRAVETLATKRGQALRRVSRGQSGRVDAKMVAELARKGDAECRRIMRETGMELGQALGALTLSMGLTRFVIGGGMAGAFDLLKAPMRKGALARAYTLDARSLKISAAKLGDDAGLLGAARVALDKV
ncbi:MAG: ROK family protein [Nitrospinota bacterium]|nr:ROK family protein [Nitrospinota bacterium]